MCPVAQTKGGFKPMNEHNHVSEDEMAALCGATVEDAEAEAICDRIKECLDCRRAWMAYVSTHECTGTCQCAE